MQPSLENGAPKSTRQTSNVTADDYVGLAMAAGAGGGGQLLPSFPAWLPLASGPNQLREE